MMLTGCSNTRYYIIFTTIQINSLSQSQAPVFLMPQTNRLSPVWVIILCCYRSIACHNSRHRQTTRHQAGYEFYVAINQLLVTIPGTNLPSTTDNLLVTSLSTNFYDATDQLIVTSPDKHKQCNLAWKSPAFSESLSDHKDKAKFN